MRGTVARTLRQTVYGKDLSPRDRKYSWLRRPVRGSKTQFIKELTAGERRRLYQLSKKIYYEVGL